MIQRYVKINTLFEHLKQNFKKIYYIILTIQIYSTTYDLNNRSGKYVHVTRFVPVIVILNGPLTIYLKKGAIFGLLT